MACQAQVPAPVQERVQAISVQQATSMAASTPAASAPVHAELTTKREICDREYSADKAPKLQWPPPGGKGAVKAPTWVNLWAAWCKPCVAEIPELREWAKEGGFGLYFVSMDDDEREWKQGAEKLELTEGSMWLQPGKGRSTWLKPVGFLDTPNLPGQILLDGQGRMRCFRSGAIESAEKQTFLSFMHAL